MAHVGNTSACKGVVLINGIAALINGIAAFVNGVTALANDPLHLQLHLQSTLGFYPFVSTFFRPSKFPAFDLSFLKGTTFPALRFICSQSLPYDRSETIVESSKTTLRAVTSQTSYHPSSPTMIAQ